MTDSTYSVLLVDADPSVRARLAEQLQPLGCTVLEAENGNGALRLLRENDVRVVLSELYLKTGEHDCLLQAVRRVRALQNTRTLAHTRHGTSPDRDWAMRAGADAYLIQPTRPDRLRYVVARLASGTSDSDSATASRANIERRDSLELALGDVERGSLDGTSSIVFSREWWSGLTPAQQGKYRKRAKQARVSLRSDSLLSNHFVEVRGPARREQGLSSERPESPYRH
jgi:CheY-like chemotaxis protein